MAASDNSNRPRYLIGYGEKLTEEARFISSPKPDKQWPYGLVEAAQRLRPRIERTNRSLRTVPVQACPKGEAVALVTLHPESLAKSYFPDALFAGIGLRTVGCRARTLQPERWSKERADDMPKEVETIELYMAGSRERFQRWAEALGTWTAHRQGGEELVRIEDVRPLHDLDNAGRVQLSGVEDRKMVLEAALHDDERSAFHVFDEFARYAHGLNVEVLADFKVFVPGIIFVPVRASRDVVERLAQFAFLRSLRPAAKLRALPPEAVTRSLGAPFTVPAAAPLNPAIRVAVLDGGLPPDHGLPAVRLYNTPGVGRPHPAFLDHGMAVTGALLWGPLAPGIAGSPPYASVDHFRVLDVDDARLRDIHAYRVLRRVQDVIETSSHDIFNLSIGPDIAVDDDDVHPWTSALDALCADGSRLLIVAAGNNGDSPAPLCRIQAPSDGVNCLSVGAADILAGSWRRAQYSAMGPGRRPGVTKPDVVAFGGGHVEPFRVVRRRGGGYVLADEMGTSFATPLVARSAAALRSFFSSNLHPLTLKCLLIHGAQDGGNPRLEVGWGRIAPDADLLECPPATARVIYQGELPPKQILRARIPIPRGLTGRIRITATICYSTEIRASDPINYTNSGVEITYRPNSGKHDINNATGKPSVYAKSAGFFTGGDYASEGERRTRDRKWETVIHASKGLEAGLLKDPVFDLHFIPRIGAMEHPSPQRIRYSMVITVSAPKCPNIYDLVLAAFPELQALTPVTVPVKV